MAYEYTVVDNFTCDGRSYVVSNKITDEAEAETLIVKHHGRSLSRHDVTSEPEKVPEPKPEPRPLVLPPKPAPVASPAASAA